MAFLPGRAHIGVMIAGNNRYLLRRTKPAQKFRRLPVFIRQAQMRQVSGHGYLKRLLTMQVVNHGQHDLITVFIPATPAP